MFSGPDHYVDKAEQLRPSQLSHHHLTHSVRTPAARPCCSSTSRCPTPTSRSCTGTTTDPRTHAVQASPLLGPMLCPGSRWPAPPWPSSPTSTCSRSACCRSAGPSPGTRWRTQPHQTQPWPPASPRKKEEKKRRGKKAEREGTIEDRL